MKFYFYLIFLFIFSCNLINYTSEEIISPSRKFIVYTTVNRTDKSMEDYADVVIHLMDNQKNIIQSVNSHVGDFSNWNLEWTAIGDALILKNSDLGNKFYIIENEKLIEVD